MNSTTSQKITLPLEENDWRVFLQQNFSFVFSAFLGGLIFLFFIWKFLLKGRSSSRKNIVLLLGPEDSGKTALFLHLRNGKVSETLPSLKPNCDKFVIPDLSEKKEIEVVDYPGNRRLSMGISAFVKKSCCIIFVLDISSKASIKTAAQNLYDLFVDSAINECRLPMCIFFNKADLNENRHSDALLEDLEREIDRVRCSRAVGLEDEEEETAYLGIEGETFKIDQLPFHVHLARGSAKDGDVEELFEFLRDME